MGGEKYNMKLSIIIVYYKTPQLLLDCLHSIYANHPDFTFEVIIIDNDSKDNFESTVKTYFPQINWIGSTYNSGFSRANNLGVKASKGEFVLILNSDTQIGDNFLEQFVSSYQEKSNRMNLGLLGCRIMSMEGKLLVGSGRGFYGLDNILNANPLFIFLRRKLRKPLKRNYNSAEIHYTDHKADFLSGSCILVEKSKMENGLYLDEDFFLYYEDLFWCFEFNKKHINFFDAHLFVNHLNAGSSANEPIQINYQIQVSSYLFLRKRYNIGIFLLCGVILWLNYKMNIFFSKKKGDKNIIDKVEKEFSIFRKYFFQALLKFKRKKSSSVNFLRYVE